MGTIPCAQCGTVLEAEARFCSRCGSAQIPKTERDPLIGRLIAGHYILEELIGVGGMGKVYRAEQTTLGRTVAIKVIHPHLLSDDQTVARFYNEAKAASRLNHPSSVGVYDFGRTEDGVMYLVMEYLTGQDLAEIIASEGPLSFRRICKIMLQILSALEEAHSLGVIHRDLKPENIFISKNRKGEDNIKVLDFGLATIIGQGATSITKPGLVCGTPDYMSPEQAQALPLDGRADLYALGVVLFELLCDRLPYTDESAVKLAYRHVHDPVPDPQECAPFRSIPDGLASITQRCMQKEPAQRYENADAMALSIASVLSTLENTSSELTCLSCGHKNPRSVNFCGNCGTPLKEHSLLPPSVNEARSTGRGHSDAGILLAPAPSLADLKNYGAPKSEPPLRNSANPSNPLSLVGHELLGRGKELQAISQAIAYHHASWIHLHGPMGIGKTALLKHVGSDYQQDGMLVVQAFLPHSGVPHAYHVIQTWLTGLMGMDLNQLESTLAFGIKLSSGEHASQWIMRGFEHLRDPKGFNETPPHDLVLLTVDHVLSVLKKQKTFTRILLCVDDWSAQDAFSKTVIERLMQDPDMQRFITVVSCAETPLNLPSTTDQSQPTIEIMNINLSVLPAGSVSALSTRVMHRISSEGIPLDVSQTAAGLSMSPLGAWLADKSPLYLQLFAEADLWPEVHPDKPHEPLMFPRLGEICVQLLSKLNFESKRLVQAVAILGDSVDVNMLSSFMGQDLSTGLTTLMRKKIFKLDGDTLLFFHPYMRQVALSLIPKEAKKELHFKAFHLLQGQNAKHPGSHPLEELVEQAYGTEDPMLALMYLEKLGETCMQRADFVLARKTLQRAFELARKEWLQGGDIQEHTVAGFAKKLGAALAKEGETMHADGIVREALEWVSPKDTVRSELNLELARIAVLRGKPRDAIRILGQLIDTLAADKTPHASIIELWVEAHRELAWIRYNESDVLAASNMMRTAWIETGFSNISLSAQVRFHQSYLTLTLELGDKDLLRELAQNIEQELFQRITDEQKMILGPILVKAHAFLGEPHLQEQIKQTLLQTSLNAGDWRGYKATTELA